MSTRRQAPMITSLVQQQSRFELLSELVKNGNSGEQTFEESVHHWVFVHELGH
jgi:hypothetical protein